MSPRISPVMVPDRFPSVFVIVKEKPSALAGEPVRTIPEIAKAKINLMQFSRKVISPYSFVASTLSRACSWPISPC